MGTVRSPSDRRFSTYILTLGPSLLEKAKLSYFIFYNEEEETQKERQYTRTADVNFLIKSNSQDHSQKEIMRDISKEGVVVIHFNPPSCLCCV